MRLEQSLKLLLPFHRLDTLAVYRGIGVDFVWALRSGHCVCT